MTLGDLWSRVGRPKLDSLAQLNAVVGDQLAARAAESDGALNPLLRSLCGESAWADLWERVLGWLSAEVWREHFASVLQKSGTLGVAFDAHIADTWAELQAINRFVGHSVEIEVELLASGADFQVRLLRTGRLAIIEVKRANGLADELRLAAEALRAGQLIYGDIESPRIVVLGTEAYHDAQFDKRGQRLDQVIADIKTLLNRDHYARVINSLRSADTVDVSPGFITAQAEDGSPGVAIQPYAIAEVKGRLDTMGILHATGDILLKARRAMPQLYVTASNVAADAPLTLAPYVYYDAWELGGGVDLGRLAEYLDTALMYEPRIGLIVDSFGDQWYFGRSPGGSFDAFTHAKPWLDHVSSCPRYRGC